MFKKQFILFYILLFINISCIAQKIKLTNITYSGLKKTKSTFVKKVSAIGLGYTDSNAIVNDVLFLKRLPAFANLTFKLEGNADGNYHLTYYFEENLTVIPYVNIWTSVQQTAFKIGVTDFNFGGKNKTLYAYYQNNGLTSYGVYYRAPNLFTKKLGIVLDHVLWQSREPLYFSGNTALYNFKILGFELAATYQYSAKLKLEISVNPFKEQYKFFSGFSNASVPQLLVKQKVAFKGEASYNALKYHYYLTSGIKNNTYIQSLPASNNFWIIWNEFLYFKRIAKKGNLGIRVHTGFSKNDISPFAPFILDNNKNIRGVGNIVDRGTGAVVINAEYRLNAFEYKNWVLQQNTFVDFGCWRKPGGKLKDFVKSNNQELYTGIGFRIINKKIYGSALRLDYGFKINNIKVNGIVFGVGQYF